MRWLVEVSAIGKGEPQSFCVDADSWQRALQIVRAHRGETSAMSGFSIELLEEGYRAVDPVARLRFVVKRAAEGTPLSPIDMKAGGSKPPAKPEAPKPDDATSAEPAKAPAGKAQPPRPADSKPAAKAPSAPKTETKSAPASKPATNGAPEKAKPEAPQAPAAVVVSAPISLGAASAGPATVSAKADVPPQAIPSQPATEPAPTVVAPQPVGAPLPGLPAFTILSRREEHPSPAAPLSYREYVFIVPKDTVEGVAVGILLGQLELVQASLEGARSGKLVQLAVFDETYVGKPPRPPLATLVWKDWRGEPVVSFPRRASVAPASRPAVSAEVPTLKPASVPPKATLLQPSTTLTDTRPLKPELPPPDTEVTRTDVDIPTDLAKTTETPMFQPVPVSAQAPAAPAQAPLAPAAPQAAQAPAAPAQTAQAPAQAPQAPAQAAQAPAQAPQAPAQAPQAPAQAPQAPAQAPQAPARKVTMVGMPAVSLPQEAAAAPQVPAAPVTKSVPPPAQAPLAPAKSVPPPAATKSVPPPAQAPLAAKSVPPAPLADGWSAPPPPVEAVAVAKSVPPPAGDAAPATTKSAPPPNAFPAMSAAAALAQTLPLDASPPLTPAPPVVLGVEKAPDFTPPPPQPRPSSMRLQAVKAAGARVSGDELISSLFEAMHDLHFLQDAIQGADFCLQLAQEVIPSRAGFAHFFDLERREFCLVRAKGDGTSELVGKRHLEAEPVLAAAAKARKAFVRGDADTMTSRYISVGGAKSLVVAPVLVAGRTLAILEMINPSDGAPFTQDEANAMTYIAEQFAEFLSSRGLVFDHGRAGR